MRGIRTAQKTNIDDYVRSLISGFAITANGIAAEGPDRHPSDRRHDLMFIVDAVGSNTRR